MDLRIESIFEEEMKNDNSFQEKENLLTLLFGGTKYSKIDMRETWYDGIKCGIEIGLTRASLKGQIVELNTNATNKKQKEFLEKFYKLAENYKCMIQYHPQKGMVVLDREH